MVGDRVIFPTFYPDNLGLSYDFTCGIKFTTNVDCYLTELGGCFGGYRYVYLRDSGGVVASAYVMSNNNVEYSQLATPYRLYANNSYYVYVQSLGSGLAYGSYNTPKNYGRVTVNASYRENGATNFQGPVDGVALAYNSQYWGVVDFSLVDDVIKFDFKTKLSGAWRPITEILYKTGGAWRSVEEVFVKVNGSWRS